MLRLGQVRSEDRMVDVLVLAVSCYHCGSPLRAVNGGAHDGRGSSWVGACVACQRQWVVTAEMTWVPSRGPDERHVNDGRVERYANEPGRYR